MTNYEFDIFVHLGDIAYGSGTYTELESHFFTVYRDILDDVPFWPSIGNHEYVTNEGDPYINVYVLPRQALDPVHHERYYSFDYGNAHFVSLDSNPEMFDAIGSGSGTDDELDWLAADLAASTADWKIVFFHHPAYSSGEHGNEADVDAQFVPIFQEHGVDLVLNGHDHDYERTVSDLGRRRGANRSARHYLCRRRRRWWRARASCRAAGLLPLRPTRETTSFRSRSTAACSVPRPSTLTPTSSIASI
jgi:hypothetical protein